MIKWRKISFFQCQKLIIFRLLLTFSWLRNESCYQTCRWSVSARWDCVPILVGRMVKRLLHSAFSYWRVPPAGWLWLEATESQSILCQPFKCTKSDEKKFINRIITTGESITVWLVSSLTRQELTKRTYVIICK